MSDEVKVCDLLQKATYMHAAVAGDLAAAIERCSELKAELAKLQAEREPRDNGDGTVTAMLPVTYPKGLSVDAVRVPRIGETYLSDGGEAMAANANYTPENPRLILLPAPKPPEPVTWHAPLIDGEWIASEGCISDGACGMEWTGSAARAIGLSRPATLGTYQFQDGVGTLIQEAGNE